MTNNYFHIAEIDSTTWGPLYTLSCFFKKLALHYFTLIHLEPLPEPVEQPPPLEPESRPITATKSNKISKTNASKPGTPKGSRDKEKKSPSPKRKSKKDLSKEDGEERKKSPPKRAPTSASRMNIKRTGTRLSKAAG